MWERSKKSLPVLLLAIAGFGVSIAIEHVHRRLAGDLSYTSFCNVNSTVNCDVVLSSRYAAFLGVSVAAWAMLFYLTLGVLAGAIASSERASTRATLAALTFLASGWGVIFSVYMAVVAFAVLHTICLMCTALYLINIGVFLAAWRLRAALRIRGSRRDVHVVQQDRLVLAGGIVLAVALAIAVGWEMLGGGAHALDAAEIQRQHPDFYRWYFAQPLAEVPVDGIHERGGRDAPVTIVEFSDFECGHCAAFHASLEDVLRRSGQNVRVVFHHFPLDSACNPKLSARLHPQACLAAVAAECAADQGKFWQYHDLLFDNQRQIERNALIGFATRLGLDVTRFTACLGSADVLARVQHDAKQGADLGVDSTPTVFINGRTIKGSLDSDRLAEAITLALSQHAGQGPVQ